MTTQTLEALIAAARAGEAQALATVRAWAPPATHPPAPARELLVREDGLLFELAARHPRWRREVFAPPPAFWSPDPLLQGLAPITRAACEAVRACVPLARHLQRQAAAHLWALERRLHLGDMLNRRERTQLARQVQRLQSLQRPLWENWVYATPAWRHDVFDELVRAWPDAPIDWREQRWFRPEWRERLGFAAAARWPLAWTPGCATTSDWSWCS